MKTAFKNKKKKALSSLTFLASLTPFAAIAHGTMESPISRVYNCYKNDNPESPKIPACAAIIKEAGGPQTIYDWNAVRNTGWISPPNGTLCSGGDRHRGLDVAGQDWPTTDISPTQDGKLEFTYYATANHPTEVVQYYISKDSYDPKSPLNWSDLEPFCEENLNGALLSSSHHKAYCPFPKGKAGKHVIYSVWKIANNGGEAFYSCMDVNIKKEGNPDIDPPTVEKGDVNVNFWISPNFNLDTSTFSLNLIFNDKIKLPLKYGVDGNSIKVPVGKYDNIKTNTITKNGFVYFGVISYNGKETNSISVSKKDPINMTVSVNRRPVSQKPGDHTEESPEQTKGKVSINIKGYPSLEIPAGVELELRGSKNFKIPLVNGMTQVDIPNGTYKNLRVSSKSHTDGYTYTGIPVVNNTVINSIIVKDNTVKIEINITRKKNKKEK